MILLSFKYFIFPTYTSVISKLCFKILQSFYRKAAVKSNALLEYGQVKLYNLSPLTSSLTEEKTSRPVCCTPQRYHPESLWVKLVRVTVNFLKLSSVSLNCPFCWLSEVITACSRHVDVWFPLQMYFRLFRYFESYGQLKDTEPSS